MSFSYTTEVTSFSYTSMEKAGCVDITIVVGKTYHYYFAASIFSKIPIEDRLRYKNITLKLILVMIMLFAAEQ